MSSDVDELTKQRRKILEACSGEDEQLVASLLDKYELFCWISQTQYSFFFFFRIYF